MKYQAKSGFSLIALLTGSIFISVGIYTIPALISNLERYKLRCYAQQLCSLLSKARLLAWRAKEKMYVCPCNNLADSHREKWGENDSIYVISAKSKKVLIQSSCSNGYKILFSSLFNNCWQTNSLGKNVKSNFVIQTKNYTAKATIDTYGNYKISIT